MFLQLNPRKLWDICYGGTAEQADPLPKKNTETKNMSFKGFMTTLRECWKLPLFYGGVMNHSVDYSLGGAGVI